MSWRSPLLSHGKSLMLALLLLCTSVWPPLVSAQDLAGTVLKCRAGGPSFNPLAPMETAGQVRALDRVALRILENWVEKGAKCPEAAEARTVFLMRWVSAHPDLLIEVEDVPNEQLLVPYVLSSTWHQHLAFSAESNAQMMTRGELENDVYLSLARMVRRGTVANVSAGDALGNWPWVKCRTKHCLEKIR